MARIKVKDLVAGQRFRFLKGNLANCEFVVNSQCRGDINACSLDVYLQHGHKFTNYFMCRASLIVDVYPYEDDNQLSLFP